MKKVLIVAFHFPPHHGSSGLLRVLKFCRYLPGADWSPVVLTANPSAYEQLDFSQVSEVPPPVPVVRAFALDTRRHLSIGGHYLRWLALPDRWVTWCLGAIPVGVYAIWRMRVDVIFTTFPIATAVLIGLILHRLTARPWVVDFRDSMTEDEYPRDPLTRRVYRWIEVQAIRRGSLFVFTAESARQMYLRRYPGLPAERCLVIPNGFDEVDFENLCLLSVPTAVNGRPLRLLHSGLIYPEERDPRAFFRAVSRLKATGHISSANLQIDLRASGAEEYHSKFIQEYGIGDIVQLLPALPYSEILKDGAAADALLLFQGPSCNHQIPAKAYEYLRLGKPILALTSAEGDTAALLRKVEGATIVDLADEETLVALLPRFLAALREGQHPLPNIRKVAQYERSRQAHELANHLSHLVMQLRSGVISICWW